MATGVVPVAANILSKSIEGYIDLAELGVGPNGKLETFRGNLERARVKVTTYHDAIKPETFEKASNWIGEEGYHLLNAHVHFDQ